MDSDRRIPTLMLVTDRRRSSIPIPQLAALAISNGVDVVQIREKDLTDRELRELTLATLEAVDDPKRITVNGSLTIARELGVGLHLPEVGLSSSVARAELGPRPLIGRSVHSPAAARSSEGADYLIAGHVFATASKPEIPPIGLDGLRRIVDAAPCPLLAIGGISATNVHTVLAAGADGVAVISAIAAAGDPASAARNMARRITMETEKTMEATATSVDVTINGKRVALTAGTTVQQFLQSKGFEDRLVVVELNEAILSRAAFAATTLTSGDRVEIVHFVGGG
jgi:thiamine biosynthesis protein ThiS